MSPPAGPPVVAGADSELFFFLSHTYGRAVAVSHLIRVCTLSQASLVP